MMKTAADKRRGTGGGTSSSSHVHKDSIPLAGTASNTENTSSSSNNNNSSNSNSNSNSNNRSNNVIAPPPRAALTRNSTSSSPAPDPNRKHDKTSHTAAAALASKGGADHDAAGRRSSSRKNSANTTTGAGGGGGGGGGGVVSSSSSGAAAKELRERDEQIARLQRELAVMEGETASFWQAKHSALNQQFLRTDTELRLLRAEVDCREGEREELRADWEVMKSELRERDDEIRSLRGQVRGLKEWVSTSTRADGQTSDEVFGDGMARLGNGLQNWVIVNFRKAKIRDLSKVDESTLDELGKLVPMYDELVDSYKVHLLQSVVSRILVEMVFGAYFVGLSKDQAQELQQLERFLSSFGSAELINQWRSLTLTILRKEAAAKMQAETAGVTEEVIIRINRLLEAVTDAASGNEARDQALRVLVNNSIELARLLVTQKAVFKVVMPEILPHQKTRFDTDLMEDIGGEDEESLSRREVWCVTFPGVVKRGDETGGSLQFKNVIAKAHVLCSPDTKF